jgi:putative endonuclease
MDEPCIYILANRSRTLYVGVTNNLQRRIFEHRERLVPGFTSRYNIKRLVYFEAFPTMLEAIAREKQLKGWRREKKMALIATMNPHRRDIGEDWRHAG